MMITNKFPQRFLSAFFLSSALLLTNCKKEDLPVEEQASATQSELPSNEIAATTAPAGSYNIINSLPSGYVKDGSRDYTAYLQSAIKNHSNIVFPGFPILVNEKGLEIGSNKIITFLNGSELRMKATSSEKYNVIRLLRSSNVTLVDPVITGDRKKHIGTRGEYGHGISILSAKNITIKNAKISDCWGDGIYINQPTGLPVPENITISGSSFYRNRRNSISVTCVNGFKVLNSYAYGLLESEGGTRPMSGIDFEPNFAYQKMKGIVVDNFTTEHMGAEGIQLRFQNLYSSGFAGGNVIDLNINKHIDKGAVLAAFLMEAKNPSQYAAVSGTVNLTNCVWRSNPKYVYFGLGWNEPKVKINLTNPVIYNTSGSLLDVSTTVSVIKRYMRSNAVYTITK